MNQAHVHLLLNHFPIIGSIFGIIVLSSGFLFKSNDIKRAGLGLFILTALISFPAFLSGEGAEFILESTGSVDKNVEHFIHIHEELAELLIWTSSIIGLLALFAMVLDIKQKTIAKYFTYLTLFIAVGNIALLQLVGTSGGKIRHTEIRSEEESSLQPNSDEHDHEHGHEHDH